MNPKSTGSDLFLRVSQLYRALCGAFGPDAVFHVTDLGSGGVRLQAAPGTMLRLNAAPAENVYVMTEADRDFLKAMKISV